MKLSDLTRDGVFVMSDQPETCRYCGARTQFMDLLALGRSGRRHFPQQLHVCPACSEVYVVEAEAWGHASDHSPSCAHEN